MADVHKVKCDFIYVCTYVCMYTCVYVCMIFSTPFQTNIISLFLFIKNAAFSAKRVKPKSQQISATLGSCNTVFKYSVRVKTMKQEG